VLEEEAEFSRKRASIDETQNGSGKKRCGIQQKRPGQREAGDTGASPSRGGEGGSSRTNGAKKGKGKKSVERLELSTADSFHHPLRR